MIALPIYFRELIEVSFYAINLPYTALLLVCFAYWIFVLLGAVDVDSFDLDFDVDADVDLDIDVDSGASPGYLIGLVRFLNLDGVPFMIFLSFLALSMWLISVLSNYYIGNHTGLFALIAIIPNLALSALIAKFLSKPLAPLFRNLDDVAKPLELEGHSCEVVFSFNKGELSQGRLTQNGNEILLSIAIDESADFDKLQKGDKVVLQSKSKNDDQIIYTVNLLPEI